MKTFLKKVKFIHVIVAIFGCFLLYVVYAMFMLSPVPWYVYNNIIKPNGIVSENTLVSHDAFKVETVFVDSVRLDDFSFERKAVKKYDSEFKEEYTEVEEIKNNIKIGTINVENSGEISKYDPSSITACIQNNEGNLIYKLETEFDSPNNYTEGESFFNIPQNTKATININVSLDGYLYSNGGKWVIESYKPLKLGMGGRETDSSEEFSSTNLKKILLYRTARSKSMKGDFPYECGEFYLKKATPIKVIDIL